MAFIKNIEHETVLPLADQVTVHGQRDRLQVIAENSVAHLIESFTENGHAEPPV